MKIIIIAAFFVIFSLPIAFAEEPSQGWEQLSDMPEVRSEMESAVIGDKIYVLGGLSNTNRATDSVFVFDTVSEDWRVGKPMPLALHHAATASHDDKLYVVGGYLDGWIPSNALLVYDSKTDSWSFGSQMPTARGALTAQFVDGKLFAIGGFNEFTRSENEMYDPVTDVWETKSTLPTPREHLASSVLDDQLYVIGGRAAQSNTDANEKYDHKTDTWEILSPLPTARSGLTASTLNSAIFVFGGEGPLHTFKENEAYIPGEGWLEQQPMPISRHGLASSTVEENIYLFGGGVIPGFSFSAITEKYHNNIIPKFGIFVFADESEVPSPLKQQKSGKNQEDIECKQGMFLAFKIDGTKSSCVKPYTLDKLIERGWALPHQDVNNWDVKQKTSEQQSAFCRDGEIKISGGYYKTLDSTLEFEWMKDIEDEEGYYQGVEVRLHNPEEYKQHAYVYVDCSMPSIDSFEDCLGAGYPIMESYPRQCRTPDGRHFVEEISTLEVKINGEKQVRRGTTQTLEIQVLRGEVPIEGARVFIDIEDYGEDIIKEFDGYTNSHGSFVFSWEIPQRFDDLETLLAIIDVTDSISSKTELFKFQVYCLPGEKGCKVEGN